MRQVLGGSLQSALAWHGSAILPAEQNPLGAQIPADAHEGSVALATLLGGAPPTQVSVVPLQVSAVVHALPSSQGAPLALIWHVAEQQLGSVPLAAASSQVSAPRMRPSPQMPVHVDGEPLHWNPVSVVQ